MKDLMVLLRFYCGKPVYERLKNSVTAQRGPFVPASRVILMIKLAKSIFD